MMKREAVVSLSTAICSLALLMPGNMQALGMKGAQDAQSDQQTAGSTDAMQMVPAAAVLNKEIDARKAQPGEQFRATLSKKVQLKDGTELPKGTELIGTVAKDDSQGASSLALRFTQADTKNGKVFPIKATIVSIYDRGTLDATNANPWTPEMLQIDQQNAMSGVDLHSRIGATNSGVLVAKKKDDVRIPQGYGIELAIGAQSAGQQNAANSLGPA